MRNISSVGRIQSVSRAIELLSLVADGQVDPTGTALAKAAGLAVPTAHHLLGTLTAHGMLVRDSHGGYGLGPRVAALAEAYHRDVSPPDYLLGPLRQLVETTGETGYLAAWRQGDIRMLAVVDGALPVRVSVPVGAYLDAHARASGKLLLAMATPDQRSAYLAGHPLRAMTPRTITTTARFDEALAGIRVDGHSVDEEEYQQGVSCIAAPVRHGDAVVASFALSVPAERFRIRREELTAALLAVTGAVGDTSEVAAAGRPARAGTATRRG